MSALEKLTPPQLPKGAAGRMGSSAGRKSGSAFGAVRRQALKDSERLAKVRDPAKKKNGGGGGANAGSGGGSGRGQ